MLYNGIGLQSAKGSSTSGRVEKNLSTTDEAVEKRRDRNKDRDSKKIYDKAAEVRENRRRKARESLNDHNSKRRLELKCAELRAKFEDEGIDEEEVDKRIQEYRTSNKSVISREHAVKSENEGADCSHNAAVCKDSMDSLTSYVPRYGDRGKKKM